MKKFTGVEEEWIEWSEDLRMIIDMKSPKLAKVMKHVGNHGEKPVWWRRMWRSTNKIIPTWVGSPMSSTDGWYW